MSVLDEDCIWTVDLGVSPGRPYQLTEYRTYQVLAANPTEARLVASQMAACTAMPVEAGTIRGVLV